ncbi:MAG TPA: hypothetical protein VFI49_04065 [Rudaea sp.]|nr:hypothetical protein [Rudaea sp.]
MNTMLRSAVSCTVTRSAFAAAAFLLAALASVPAHALPAFNRQTGQNCVACHAGGQFPELTPYGRLFKLTGYTIGERQALPIAVMAVASDSHVSNTSKSEDPGADFQKNNSLIFATASIFAAGKITDNLGAFVQVTYDNYAAQSDNGNWHGHSGADNMDFRYADRVISPESDIIWGVTANNNPSVADPWNSAAAWMQYVPVPSPTSSSFIDGNTPYPGFAAGGNIAGLAGYLYWNQLVYVEVGGYRTANGITGFMSAGVPKDEKTKLQGTNPYWRVALNKEWGAHSLMVGTSGMVADVYDDPLDTSDPNSVHHFRDIGIDSQYQYLLDPHAVTVQLAYTHDTHRYPYFLADQPVVDIDGNTLPNTNTNDTTNVFRAKGSYVYDAKYGTSLAFFNQTGSTNSALYDPTPVYGNINANPAIRGFTSEVFWTPVQYLRIGLQFTTYSKYNGAAHNYDGAGRNASDNNSLFLYLWGAF